MPAPVVAKAVGKVVVQKVVPFVVRRLTKEAEEQARTPLVEDLKDQLKDIIFEETGVRGESDTTSIMRAVASGTPGLGNFDSIVPRFTRLPALTEQNGTGRQQLETNVEIEMPPMWDADP